MRNHIIIALLVLGLAFPCFALAKSIDGASPCLCAITKVIECDSQGKCGEISPEAVNIPTFIKVDFKSKTLSGVNTTDSRTTAIKNIEKSDGNMILQGAENQRAWSMMVSKETGKLSGSVSGKGFGFMVFGACTLLP